MYRSWKFFGVPGPLSSFRTPMETPAFEERSQDLIVVGSVFMLFSVPWQADFEMATENFQIKIIILQCDNNLNQGAVETFLFLVPKS